MFSRETDESPITWLLHQGEGLRSYLLGVFVAGLLPLGCDTECITLSVK